MKYYILTIVFTFLILVSCKTKKNPETAAKIPDIKEASASTKTIGKISHQFKSTGCTPVIIVTPKGEKDSLILIPKDVLPAILDIDGMDVSFNYHTLRMPQPEGCTQGIPAEITNLEKLIK